MIAQSAENSSAHPEIDQKKTVLQLVRDNICFSISSYVSQIARLKRDQADDQSDKYTLRTLKSELAVIISLINEDADHLATPQEDDMSEAAVNNLIDKIQNLNDEQIWKIALDYLTTVLKLDNTSVTITQNGDVLNIVSADPVSGSEKEIRLDPRVVVLLANIPINIMARHIKIWGESLLISPPGVLHIRSFSSQQLEVSDCPVNIERIKENQYVFLTTSPDRSASRPEMPGSQVLINEGSLNLSGGETAIKEHCRGSSRVRGGVYIYRKAEVHIGTCSALIEVDGDSRVIINHLQSKPHPYLDEGGSNQISWPTIFNSGGIVRISQLEADDPLTNRGVELTTNNHSLTIVDAFVGPDQALQAPIERFVFLRSQIAESGGVVILNRALDTSGINSDRIVKPLIRAVMCNQSCVSQQGDGTYMGARIPDDHERWISNIQIFQGKIEVDKLVYLNESFKNIPPGCDILRSHLGLGFGQSDQDHYVGSLDGTPVIFSPWIDECHDYLKAMADTIRKWKKLAPEMFENPVL